MKTGNTRIERASLGTIGEPQWSPVMKTGNTPSVCSHFGWNTSLNGARS